MKNDKNAKLLLKYIVIWAICALIIFIPFIPGRKSLVIVDDGFNQCYPALAYLGQWYRELIKGNLIQYDFTIGFGDDVFGCMSWYGLGDILLVPFCLVPENLLELSYTLSILFRLFLAGLLFLLVVGEEIPDYSKITGAIVYSFCPYVFNYSFIFLIFATPMVWIPLIALGVKEILKKSKKISLKLFFGTFFLALSGFYFLFMAIIAFAVYLFMNCVITFEYDNESIKEKLNRTLSILITVVMATLCASIELVPLIEHFAQSPRTSSISFSFSNLFGFRKILDATDTNVLFSEFSSIVLNGKDYDLFKMPLLPAVFLICFFYLIRHSKQIKKQKLVWTSTLAVFSIVSEGVAIIMNGFSYPYTRYHVFVYFIIAYVIAETIPYIADEWDFIDSFFVVIVIIGNTYNSLKTRLNGNADRWLFFYVIAPIFMLIFLTLKNKYSTYIISIITIAFVIMYGYLFNTTFEEGGNGFNGATYWMHGAQEAIETSSLYEVSRLDKIGGYGMISKVEQ